MQTLEWKEQKHRVFIFRTMSAALILALAISILFVIAADIYTICNIHEKGLASLDYRYLVPIITINFVYVFLAPVMIIRAIINKPTDNKSIGNQAISDTTEDQLRKYIHKKDDSISPTQSSINTIDNL